MKNNTANNTVEFVSNEEMSNYVSDAKQLPLSTIRKALADAQISYTSNAARPTYMQHMINTGVWVIAPTNEPIQTEEKENEPMDNVHNESPANDANLTDTPANVAPIDTNVDVPIVQLAQPNESANVPPATIELDNLPQPIETPIMTKEEALAFLKEYETHANAYANAYLKADETFATLLKIGATEEKNRQLTVTGLVAASGILATNVDAYLSEKFANKKIGQTEYKGIATVQLAREIAESKHDRLARQIANFEFSLQGELDKVLTQLLDEVIRHYNGEMPTSNYTIGYNGNITFVNPIAAPATTSKRANKTAATNEGETKKRASYKVKDGLSVLKTGKDWSIHLTTAGNVYCFACTKTGKENCMITGEFSDTVGKSFAQNANSAYQYVTSPESRISVVQFFPSSCFDFEETTN